MKSPRVTLALVGSRREGPDPRWFELLAAPLASGALEVLLVTSATCVAPASVRVVTAPEGTILPRLRALGLVAARADHVVLTEDVFLPATSWWPALLGAIQRSSAIAIGGPIDRECGGSRAWAHTFAEHARFLPGGREGSVDDLPCVNVVYARTALRSLLGALPEMIIEGELHARILRAGGRLECVAALRMFDIAPGRLVPDARAFFHHGRVFGGRRVESAGIGTRVVRAALSGVVPTLQLSRSLCAARRARRVRRWFGALPSLVLLYVCWAFGEGVGSLFGVGRSLERWQ